MSALDKNRSSARQPWRQMKIRELGELSEVIRGGGGKLTIAGGDPGDGGKQQGGEP